MSTLRAAARLDAGEPDLLVASGPRRGPTDFGVEGASQRRSGRTGPVIAQAHL